MFDVGVAFIGKRPPASYEKEPWKRYDVATTAFQALPTPEDIVTPLPSDDQRAHTRHNIAVDMQVEMVDENGEVIESEHTVTENISSQGRDAFYDVTDSAGRFIRLTSDATRDHGICGHSIAKHRRRWRSENSRRVHR